MGDKHPRSWHRHDQGQCERIFDKFYRADSSDTAVSGLGLGMSIARQVVNLHDGWILVDIIHGKGTKVTSTLPRA